jgi:hypothetical protein
MNDHRLRAIANREARARRLPPDARCAACGATEHLAPTADGRILCYEDCRVAAGASPIERDHIAGREVIGGITVRLWGNDHRTVTELRSMLGMDDWPPADGDPLLTLAYLAAGIATLLWLAALYLVELATDATRRLGAKVWDGAPRVPFA